MPEPLKLAELCAGYGGLGLALTHASINHQLTWYAEHAPEPATVLAHHHPNTPNHGDLTTITNPPPADIITAGFPCQPVSVAGQRKGINDERWLIRDIVTIWRSTGARWLFLENVPGLLTANNGNAFGEVIDALTEVRATAQWAHLRAAAVGAPHRRERWFCLAENPDSEPRQQRRQPTPGQAESGWPWANTSRRSRASATHADGATLRPEPVPIPRGGGAAVTRPDPPAAANTTRPRLERPGQGWATANRFGSYAAAVHQWETTLGRQAPNPTTNEGRLNPAFVEWMMGLPDGWVTDTPGLTRNAMLRILGNGVVIQQAAHAYTQLAAQLHERTAA